MLKYQIRPTELREPILARGYIESHELFRIIAWKSAKGLAWLSLNDPKKIEQTTRETLRLLKEWDGPHCLLESHLVETDWIKWEALAGALVGADEKNGGPRGLLRLTGVGYPVATAVLSILEPDLFPVLDKWGVRAIFGKEVSGSTKRWHNKSAYRQYTQALADPEFVNLREYRTLRDRDVATMTAGKQDKVMIKEWPIALR